MAVCDCAIGVLLFLLFLLLSPAGYKGARETVGGEVKAEDTDFACESLWALTGEVVGFGR